MAGGVYLPAMLLGLPLPRSDWGTYLTLTLMGARVRADMVSAEVRRLGTAIAADAGTTDGTELAVAVRGFLERRIYFLRDPDGAEMLHSPRWQATRLLTGRDLYLDCDDVAMLAACLGKAIGLKARFIVAAFSSPNAPYRHVWTQLRSPSGGPWIECDITRPAQGLDGVTITRRLVWSI